MSTFKLFIFSGSNPIFGFEKEWESTYLTWKSVWEDAFSELGTNKKVYSDDFTRTHDVLSLFDQDKCVMVLFFRNSQMDLITSRDDSYFECWDQESIDFLAKDSNNVGITNYVTIPKFCRGDYKGISLKNLMMSFIHCYVNEYQYSALAGTTRNNRGIDKATSAVGASLLDTTKKLHGVDVNLVAFYKKIMKTVIPEYSNLANTLWEKRIDHKFITNLRSLNKSA